MGRAKLPQAPTEPGLRVLHQLRPSPPPCRQRRPLQHHPIPGHPFYSFRISDRPNTVPVLSKGFQELPWAGRRLSGHPWNPDFGGPGRQADLRPCVGRHGRCRVTPPRATRSKVLRFQIGRSLSKVFSKTFFRMLLSSPSNIRDHRHLFLIAGAKPNWGTQVTNPTKSLRLWVLCDVNSNPARAGRGDAA